MAYVDIVNNMNPIHFWELQTGSLDTGTGNVLNGTDTNMEYQSISIVKDYSTASSFNLDGHIEIATSNDLDDATVDKCTISFWLMPTLDTLSFNIIKIGDDTEGMYVAISAGMIPMVGVVHSSLCEVVYGNSVVINEPVHILYEFDNGINKIYQNNVLVKEYTSTNMYHDNSTNGTIIGGAVTINIDGDSFNIYDLHGKLSMLAIWNSVLTTQQKSDLFTEGSQPVNRTIKFLNLPLKTEVEVYDINDNLALIDGVEFIDNVTGSDIDIEFSVNTELLTRIVLLNVENKRLPFHADLLLKRQNYTFDGDLILEPDLTYNHDSWVQPIPIVTVDKPYLTGKTEDGGILTCNPGVYTGSGTLTRSYQWYRDGSPISGETSTTYTIVSGDIDLPLFCRETVDNIISNIFEDSNIRTWLNVKIYCIYENSVGDLIPSTSWVVVDFENEIQNINSKFSNSNGTYTIPAGDYLVIATMKYQDDSNGRVDPEGRIVYTGSGNEAPIYGSGFSRNSNNKISWIRSTSYIHNAADGDTISFEHRSDSDAMTNGSIAGYCHIQIINMNPNALLLANDTSDTGAYSGTTWNLISWDNQIVVQGTSITKDNNSFILAGNKDYLISYGIAFANSSGDRTQRISKAQSAQDDIAQSFSYAYMRNSSNEYGDIGNMFMYSTGENDEYLEFFSQRGDALSDGTTVRRVNTSSVFILDVTGANYYSSKDSVANQLITGTDDLELSLLETEKHSTSDLLKIDNNTLSCQTESYWIIGSSIFVNNTAHSGSTRLTRGIKLNINDVSQRVGESGSYQRNDQSSTDTWDLGMAAIGVYHLLDGDELNVVSFDAGEDGNSNSYTIANKCGMWALDINSI